MTLVDLRDGTAAETTLARYEDDPFAWAQEQSALILQRRFDLLDLPNLADEVATLAHYLADKLRSDLVRVIQHVLKWDHQSVKRSRSWALSVREHRRRVDEHLRRAPGLRSILPELVESAYLTARFKVLKETALPQQSLPPTCPYDWDAIMHREIPWPDPS